MTMQFRVKNDSPNPPDAGRVCANEARTRALLRLWGLDVPVAAVGIGALGRRGPADGVVEHRLDVLAVIDGVGLVARSEVEELPAAPAVATARAEHLTALEPRGEDEAVRFRNAERLAVGLGRLDDDRVAQAVDDGVAGVRDPEPLALGAL